MSITLLEEEITHLKRELAATRYAELTKSKKTDFHQKTARLNTLLMEVIHVLETKTRTAEEDKKLAFFLYLGFLEGLHYCYQAFLKPTSISQPKTIALEDTFICALQLLLGIGQPLRPEEAFKLLLKIVHNNNHHIEILNTRIEIDYLLGWMYQQGLGVTKNDDETVRHYRLAAAQGLAAAQHKLGLMYQEGLGVPKNDDEALRYYRLAAEQGLAAAQNNLGWIYQNGLGVQKNYDEALRYYHLAAEQGLAAAQNNLGWIYQNGLGVQKNYDEALRYYRLAAEQGLASAQNNIGLMYQEGQGVPQSDIEAVRYYRLAAEQGLASAQNNIGLMYQEGQGVPQSDIEAVRYYRLAAVQGLAIARENLSIMDDHAEADYHLAMSTSNLDALATKLLSHEPWWNAFLTFDATTIKECESKQTLLIQMIEQITKQTLTISDITQQRLHFLLFILYQIENQITFVDSINKDPYWYLQLPLDELNQDWLNEYAFFLFHRWFVLKEEGSEHQHEIDTLQEYIVKQLLINDERRAKLMPSTQTPLKVVFIQMVFTAFEATLAISQLEIEDIQIIYSLYKSTDQRNDLISTNQRMNMLLQDLLKKNFLLAQDNQRASHQHTLSFDEIYTDPNKEQAQFKKQQDMHNKAEQLGLSIHLLTVMEQFKSVFPAQSQSLLQYLEKSTQSTNSTDWSIFSRQPSKQDDFNACEKLMTRLIQHHEQKPYEDELLPQEISILQQGELGEIVNDMLLALGVKDFLSNGPCLSPKLFK